MSSRYITTDEYKNSSYLSCLREVGHHLSWAIAETMHVTYENIYYICIRQKSQYWYQGNFHEHAVESTQLVTVRSYERFQKNQISGICYILMNPIHIYIKDNEVRRATFCTSSLSVASCLASNMFWRFNPGSFRHDEVRHVSWDN